jgi:D-aminoacyl-tRNA deacylase
MMFVEIGSSEAQWQDLNVARQVVEVLLEALEAESAPAKLAIGFGGPHYARKFTRLVLESQFALGPVAAKYALPDITSSMVRQMVDRTPGAVRYAAVEWKGLGSDKHRLLRLLADAELEILRV